MYAVWNFKISCTLVNTFQGRLQTKDLFEKCSQKFNETSASGPKLHEATPCDADANR